MELFLILVALFIVGVIAYFAIATMLSIGFFIAMGVIVVACFGSCMQLEETQKEPTTQERERQHPKGDIKTDG